MSWNLTYLRLIVASFAGLSAFVNPAFAQTQVTLHQLYSFTGGNDGGEPAGALVQGSDGNFYGTTVGGGNGYGTVFKMTPSDALTTLVSFNGTDGSEDAGPDVALMGNAPLVQGSDGNFYGVTPSGGANDYGTVFQVTPSGTLTTLFSFNFFTGAFPQGALVEGCDGNFYGTTEYGSDNESGTVFKITTNGALVSLYSFSATDLNGNNSDGADPVAGLVQGIDGNFYGTTTKGGASGDGTVFKMTPSGTLTTLASFNGADGIAPYSAVIQGSDGNFYGTTYVGGNLSLGVDGSGLGTLFKITPSGILTTLVSFNGTNGAYPIAAPVQGSDGNFYGTTYDGGSSFDGNVFQLTPSGTLTTLVSFNGGIGYWPEAALVEGNDGNLYGTTYSGGAYDYGTVFMVPTALPAVGSLEVTLSPAGVVNAGAQWQVDGGAWRNSGSTVAGLAVGSHTVGFSPVAGWVVPVSQNVTVSSNQTTTASGIYAVVVTPPFVSGCAVFSHPTDTILVNGHTSVTNQITIEAEILIPSSFPVPTYSYPRIFEEQLSGSGDKQLWASPTSVGGSTWLANNQSAGIGVPNPGANDVWHHLAFIQDFNEDRVYLDGVEIGTNDFSGAPSIANSPDSVMSIGAFLYTDGGALAQSFIGAIQWVRVSCVARYSGASVTPPVTVPPCDAFTQILFDFSHLAPGTSTVYDLSLNHFIGTVGVGFSGATAPSFVLPAPPMFQTMTQTNQTLTLTWSTVAGQIYELQYTTNVAQPHWINWFYPLVATNTVITVTDTIGPDPQRFYQVVQSP